MKSFILILTLTAFLSQTSACCGVMAFACGGMGHDDHKPGDPEVAASDAAKPDVPESANAAYPLTTCVVSGEKLGEMGDIVEYTHKEEGKPDRLVRFCCSSCIMKFKKDPAKYLAKLDEAEKAAADKPAAGKREADRDRHPAVEER